MLIALAAVVIFFMCMLSVLALGNRFLFLKQSYYFGINLWSRWIPVVATAGYIAILGTNVVGGRNPLLRYFDLGSVLTFPELVVLFLIGPMFFSGAGSLLSAGTLIYLVERLMIEGVYQVQTGWLLLIGAVTITSVLADKMPWVPQRATGSVSALVREVLLAIMSFAALGSIFAVFLRAGAFTTWAASFSTVSLHSNALFLLLGILAAGWITIALGITRHFTLPMVALPSIVLVAFITRWPSYVLVVPLCICIALSLAVADRRKAVR